MSIKYNYMRFQSKRNSFSQVNIYHCAICLNSSIRIGFLTLYSLYLGWLSISFKQTLKCCMIYRRERRCWLLYTKICSSFSTFICTFACSIKCKRWVAPFSSYFGNILNERGYELQLNDNAWYFEINTLLMIVWDSFSWNQHWFALFQSCNGIQVSKHYW